MITIQDVSVRGPSSAENCETRYTTWFMYDMLSNKEEDENEKIKIERLFIERRIIIILMLLISSTIIRPINRSNEPLQDKRFCFTLFILLNCFLLATIGHCLQNCLP